MFLAFRWVGRLCWFLWRRFYWWGFIGRGGIESRTSFRCPAPKGASDLGVLAVSLKRYPDTKLESSAACEAMPFPKNLSRNVCCGRLCLCPNFSSPREWGNRGSNKWSPGDGPRPQRRAEVGMATCVAAHHGENLYHREHRGHGGILGVTSGSACLIQRLEPA